MKHVVVYGPGCTRCANTADLVQTTAAKLGIAVTVTKETDMTRIAMAGVIATPGIAVDGELVHTGGLPDVDALEVWLSS